MCILIITIDESVRNFFELTCYSNCGIINADNDEKDIVNPADKTIRNYNGCCNNVETTSGFSLESSAICTTACKFCYKCIYNYYISLHI